MIPQKLCVYVCQLILKDTGSNQKEKYGIHRTTWKCRYRYLTLTILTVRRALPVVFAHLLYTSLLILPEPFSFKTWKFKGLHLVFKRHFSRKLLTKIYWQKAKSQELFVYWWQKSHLSAKCMVQNTQLMYEAERSN